MCGEWNCAQRQKKSKKGTTNLTKKKEQNNRSKLKGIPTTSANKLKSKKITSDYA